MNALTGGITGPAIQRIYDDARAVFGSLADVRVPRVTLDLPGSDPEPFHVFVWGTARQFDIAGALTGNIILVTFRVRMTLIASGATADDAADIANAYLARAVQITLCDPTLGGTVEEVGWPQITEADAWADQSGRRHAGYLLEFEASKYVAADPAVRAVIEGVTDDE